MMMQIGFWTDTGEFYSVNMRYLRQQILRGRDKAEDGATSFVVRMPAPDEPETHVDAFMRAGDLYLYGFQNRHCGFYFKDNPGLRLIANQRLLGFSGHYSELGDYGALSISRGAITAAITQLSRWRRDTAITNKEKDRFGVQQLTAAARHLLMLILMVSEAARFFEIERTIANALDGIRDTPLTPAMIQRLTHEWDSLSKAGDFRRVAIMNRA
jgi:hypothetical protein